MLFSVQLCGQLYQPQVLNDTVDSHKALMERAIIPFPFRNDTVDDFNNLLRERMPGAEHRFEAANYMAISQNATVAKPFAVEYLQSISLALLLASCLQLKIGEPIILLGNLGSCEGRCNGMRMRVLGIRRNSIEVAIMGKRFDGKVCLHPGIKLTTCEEELPFILQHTLFPICLCYAMTINKSQDPSLEHVGIYLYTLAFTHGQLYVVLSRVTSLNGLTLLPSEQTLTLTQIIVYLEVHL